MTPADLASLHACCFTLPRPWSEKEFADLVADARNFLLVRSRSFLLGRVVADQSELLTLAVAPESRRQGLADSLLSDFLARSSELGATIHFLEVAADNHAAQNLYYKQQWQAVGRRKNYYAPGLDAIVMSRVCAKT